MSTDYSTHAEIHCDLSLTWNQRCFHGNTHEILGLVKSLIRLWVRSTKGNKGQNHALYFDYERENKKKPDQITKEDWIFWQSMVVIFRTL